MTAPEPTRPADEHIDAVARVVHRFVESHDRDEMVADLLTSTDPAVHEALAARLPADVMLDALVRAGVLTEERHRVVPSKGARPKRLVTPWQVAP